MRADNFTYQPQFLLLIMGNNKPNLHSVDNAMRRRFIMLPFETRPAEPDPELPEKLKAEWPGILRWAIEGCLDGQINGLVRSDRDRAATEEYFENQDAFGQWLAEECDCDPGNKYKTATNAELYQSWQNYTRLSGEEAGSNKTLCDKLEKRGIVLHRTNSFLGYRGIRLRRKRSVTAALCG